MLQRKKREEVVKMNNYSEREISTINKKFPKESGGGHLNPSFFNYIYCNMTASIISSNSSPDNIPIQFSSEGLDYSSSWYDLNDSGSYGYTEAEEYDPIEEGFHLSKLNEESFKRAILNVLNEDLEFKKLYLRLQHDLKVVNLNDTRTKEIAQCGVYSFFNDNFSKYMRGVDAENLHKLVVISNYNEADEKEKKVKASRASSKKRAWTKKADIIQSTNKCKKRAVASILSNSDHSSCEWHPDKLRVMRQNPTHHESQESFHSNKSYKPIAPYNPVIDDEVISLSDASHSTESEEMNQESGQFCLAESLKTCFKSLLQTRKSSALNGQNPPLVSQLPKQCHYCGQEFEDSRILQQHFNKCTSSDIEVTIPEPEKYLCSQKTPKFNGHQNVSQGSGASFSFKWSANSSAGQDSQLKSVLIDLNPEVKQLQTWIISQQVHQQEKAEDQRAEIQAQIPQEFQNSRKQVQSNKGLLSSPIDQEKLQKSPEFSKNFVSEQEIQQQENQALSYLDEIPRVIQYEEPSEIEKSPQIVKYQSPSRRKNSSTSIESTAQTQSDPRRVKWFTEYLRRKSQICPYCSHQIKEAKNRSSMKQHMSECMTSYLKFGVKRKWAIFGRNKNELVGLPEIKARQKKQ